MTAQYKPDTRPVRAMFRSIRVGDVDGLRESLAQDADPNALYGKDGNPRSPPLSRVLWFHGHDSHKGPLLARVLLEAGARMDLQTSIWRQSMMISEEGVLREFVKFAGGLENLVDTIPPETLRNCLGLIVGNGPIGSLRKDIFLEIWGRLGGPEGPVTESLSRIPWPWSQMSSLPAIPKEMMKGVESYVPRPSPDTIPQSIWSQWMVSMSRQDSPSSQLFKEGLRQTPPKWWFSHYERDGGSPSKRTLLDELLSFPTPDIIRAGLKAVQAMPGGWDHPDVPDPGIFVRAGAHSASMLDLVMRLVPKGDYYHAFSLALLDVVGGEGAPMSQRSQKAVVKKLLEMGADPFYQTPKASSPLHLVASWRESSPAHLMGVAKMLLDAGARWDAPKDEGGWTPMQVLQDHHPQIAAQVVQGVMEAAIPRASEDTAPRALRRPGRL